MENSSFVGGFQFPTLARQMPSGPSFCQQWEQAGLANCANMYNSAAAAISAYAAQTPETPEMRRARLAGLGVTEVYEREP